ncbi:hypothetical protein JCM24511_02682 [Saitozyma sp. JCM 24511]|nr:hypothetical protein JCM24511_02682 [Saitozyma sp. JCM 24511]
MREIPLDWKGTFPLAVWSIKIDLDTCRQLTPKRLMRYADVGNGVSEGPHVYKRDGYYYLLTAEGGTEVEHQEWVSRSRRVLEGARGLGHRATHGVWDTVQRSGFRTPCEHGKELYSRGPQGPWEVGPSWVNPMVQGDDVEIRQTGHMDLFESIGGQWWTVVLGVRPVYGPKGEALLSPLGRETFLAPVEWVGGWPIVNRRQKITLNGQVGLLPRLEEKFSKRFNFNPDKREYDLSLRPGSLALFGGPWDIQVNESVTMLLQRQTAFDGRWEVEIDYPPSLRRHEAGTAVWWSNDGPIRIHIDTTPTYYTFYLVTGTQRNKIGQITSSHLTGSRPFDSSFTGTHFALYAQGADDESTLTPAFFSDVSWSGRRAGGP